MEQLKVDFTGVNPSRFTRLLLCKFENKESILRSSARNTERLAEVVANKYVLLDPCNDYKINKEFNSHIKNEIERAGVNNWFVHEFNWCGDIKYLNFKMSNLSIYQRECFIDLKNGNVEPVLRKGEQICLNCGAILGDSNKKFGEFCECCFLESSAGRFYGYHGYHKSYKVLDKNASKLDFNKMLTFGIEIERDFVEGSCASDRRREAILKTCKIFYKKPTRDMQDKLVFMSDGSLSFGGCEIITHPATEKYYKTHKKEFEKMLEIFAEQGFKNSYKCGNHIHVNRSFFEGKSRECACKLALLVSEFWAEFKAISKRENTDYSYRPSLEKTDDLFTLVEKSINSREDHGIAINQQHSNTIEIRLWSGVDSVEELLYYIAITKAMCKFVKRASIEKIQKMKFEDFLKTLKAEDLRETGERLKARGLAYARTIKRLLKEECGE